MSRPTTPAMLDRFGRLHTYLRVSVTDRCNYRCVYCLPAEGVSWMPREDVLSFEEIARVVRVMAGMGLRRVRLTGGEPTVRKDIERLVGAVAAVPGIEDVAMTTNAHRLASQAKALKAAGLSRVNVSLDSLDPGRFGEITRGGDLAAVVAGIEASVEAGLLPVKVNMVVMRGVNDDEVVAMARWCGARGVVLRYIEYMPFEARWHQSVPAAEIRGRLSADLGVLVPEAGVVGTGPAKYARVGEARIGFISPLTEHFCASCNRLRLLADGHLRTCLAHEDTPSLREEMRRGASDGELAALVLDIVRGKPAGHEAQVHGGREFEGVMTAIGG